jgi:hypothetical protein
MKEGNKELSSEIPAKLLRENSWEILGLSIEDDVTFPIFDFGH